MEPVFTLQWPEFVIAQQLQKLLPRKEGYSVFIPMSRQEKGVDLAILHRTSTGPSVTTTIQVKASRTYQHAPPKRKTTVRYRFNTLFNRFEVSDLADFVILFALYPPDPGQTKSVSATWYEHCSLIFTRDDMRQLMADCKTVKGEPDRMFGFGFNDLSKIVLNRGDEDRLGKDFAKNLLERKSKDLMMK